MVVVEHREGIWVERPAKLRSAGRALLIVGAPLIATCLVVAIAALVTTWS